MQYKVGLLHIGWVATNETLRKTVSYAGPNSPAITASENMYTGDEFKRMEVTITCGDLKGHIGTVKATREQDGRTVVDILTGSKLQNTFVSLDIDHVVERL